MNRRSIMVIIWLVWIVAIFATFAVIENYGLTHDDGLTFSRLIYDAQHAWPLLGPLMGVGAGILLCHFFWNWSPKEQERIKYLERIVGDQEAELNVYRAVSARKGNPT